MRLLRKQREWPLRRSRPRTLVSHRAWLRKLGLELLLVVGEDQHGLIDALSEGWACWGVELIAESSSFECLQKLRETILWSLHVVVLFANQPLDSCELPSGRELVKDFCLEALDIQF